jgi:hypothetical protein
VPNPQTLDKAGKAHQGQTLQLIAKICKLRKKSFITLFPRVSVLKITTVIVALLQYARLFATASHLQPSLIIAGKARGLPLE